MRHLFFNPFGILKRRINALSGENDEHQIAQRLSPERTVLSGPFLGLRYPGYAAYDSVLVPKLLGIYEKELHPWISEIIHSRYGRIVDIGCAEGYYAVGFAGQIPESTVWALDINPEALAFCTQMARANNVDQRMHIQIMPDIAGLKKILFDNSFIFSDCEGGELKYFNMKNLPQLTTCDFLIELHEAKHPQIKTLLTEQFRRTHTIRFIRARKRRLTDIPIKLRGRILGSEQTALNEFRTDGYTWMYAKTQHNHHL